MFVHFWTANAFNFEVFFPRLWDYKDSFINKNQSLDGQSHPTGSPRTYCLSLRRGKRLWKRKHWELLWSKACSWQTRSWDQGKTYRVWFDQTGRKRIHSSCFKLFAKRTLSYYCFESQFNSTIYTDGFKTYDGLVNFGDQKHYRAQHGNNEFANGHNHINGIENFWGWAKMRLTKCRGISQKTFFLHLKECEYRFNHRNEDLYKILLKELRKFPLKLSWTNLYSTTPNRRKK